MPDDWTGDVEFVENGEILETTSAEEARKRISDAIDDGYDFGDMEVRQSTEDTQAAHEQRIAEFHRDREKQQDERRTRQELANRPGGDEWVEPPSRLYHATFAGDKIREGGFKSAEELGPDSDVLGGSVRSGVSFTDQATANEYRDGLETARAAAQGSVNPDNSSQMAEIAAKYGVSKEFIQESVTQNSTGSTSERMFRILQAVSFEGKKFPLFVGGSWPASVKNATTSAEILSIETPEFESDDVTYHPSENEWRISNTKKIGEVR